MTGEKKSEEENSKKGGVVVRGKKTLIPGRGYHNYVLGNAIHVVAAIQEGGKHPEKSVISACVEYRKGASHLS